VVLDRRIGQRIVGIAAGDGTDWRVLTETEAGAVTGRRMSLSRLSHGGTSARWSRQLASVRSCCIVFEHSPIMSIFQYDTARYVGPTGLRAGPRDPRDGWASISPLAIVPPNTSNNTSRSGYMMLRACRAYDLHEMI
jgi:hypothetical protein